MEQIRERQLDVDEILSQNASFEEYFNEGADDESEEIKVARGRPKKEANWSRVISLTKDDLNMLHSYNIKDDLENESNIVAAMKEPDDGVDWTPHFWPDAFADQADDLSIEGNRLSNQELYNLGV